MSKAAQAQIDQIDTEIDVIRTRLYLRLRFYPVTAREFQAAWDRCPDLHAAQAELYRRRGDAQRQRDAEIEKQWQAQQRRERRERVASWKRSVA